MNKVIQKVYAIILLVVFVGIINMGVLLIFKPQVAAQAESENRCQLYTNSDKLLNAEGQEIEKTITEFAEAASLLQAGGLIKFILKPIFKFQR